MEITPFVLGMLSVVFALGIILSVFSARKIANLEKEINSIVRELEDSRRNTDSSISNVYRSVDERFDHLFRDLDSRLDKLENRLKNSKQLLKD